MRSATGRAGHIWRSRSGLGWSGFRGGFSSVGARMIVTIAVSLRETHETAGFVSTSAV